MLIVVVIMAFKQNKTRYAVYYSMDEQISIYNFGST